MAATAAQMEGNARIGRPVPTIEEIRSWVELGEVEVRVADMLEHAGEYDLPRRHQGVEEIRALADLDLLDVGSVVLEEARRRGVTLNDCPAWCETPSHPDLFSEEAHTSRLTGDDSANVDLVQDERSGRRELAVTIDERTDPAFMPASGAVARLRDLAAMLTAAADRLERIEAAEMVGAR